MEDRFGRFKPGVISEELQDALGVTDKSLPPFIYRMRQLGYPPGWLKEAELENSGLALYDGRDGAEGAADTPQGQLRRNVTYDLSKLVNYPGFNISTPRGVPDEWRVFGSIPMQACQHRDVFASYLTANFQAPGMRPGTKRSSCQSSPTSPKKQRKDGSSAAAPADMELDSDAEGPPGAFKFQPPLPPGTPPPLPQGTPPPIFVPPLPKGTPPLTPSDSPQTRRASSSMDEDALTLEELEEQQRRIWAALEQAESVPSDSELPSDTPFTGNSVASSPSLCPNEPDPPLLEGKAPGEQGPAEPELANSCPEEPEASPSLEPAAPELCPGKEELAAGALDNGDALPDGGLRNGGGPGPLQMDASPSATVETHLAASPSAVKTHSPVPDMSKFATGITPFEFENMAESTGMYLRIRSLLKNSPRNQQRNKKASD